MVTIIKDKSHAMQIMLRVQDKQIIQITVFNVLTDTSTEYYDVYNGAIYHNSSTVFMPRDAVANIIYECLEGNHIPSSFYSSLLKKLNESYELDKKILMFDIDLDNIISLVSSQYHAMLIKMKESYDKTMEMKRTIDLLNKKWCN